jgi:NAD(P)-dependent dehydrogenase (short-subunit alcohol dehydrogenase family)
MPQTVLITGANRGIGLALVRTYLAQGDRVIGTCRAPEKAEELKKIVADNPHLSLHALDVTDGTSIRSLVHTLEGQALDILVNNAGILSGNSSPFNAMTVEHDPSQTLGSLDAEAWGKVLRTNTIAPLMLTQGLLPHLRLGKTRNIAMISSSWGSITKMDAEVPLAYGSSKAALNAATKILASTLQKEGFVVLSLNPGWVRTDMGSSDASLEPQQSAERLVNIMKAATPEQTGQFISHTGEILPW